MELQRKADLYSGYLHLSHFVDLQFFYQIPFPMILIDIRFSENSYIALRTTVLKLLQFR